MIALTRLEYLILHLAYDLGYKYIARDYADSNGIWFYKEKPVRFENEPFWFNSAGNKQNSNFLETWLGMFRFVMAEDDPYKIEELLTYEVID